MVYKIIRDDGLIYIGTTNEKAFRGRMNSHRYSKRFKERNFEIDILLQSISYDFIQNMEEHYIKTFDSYKNGLNESINGKGNHMSKNFTTRGYKFSKKSRERMSRAKKGIIPWNKGKKGCHSKESLKRISEKNKGQRRSYKLDENQRYEIMKEYNDHNYISNDVNKVMKNGRVLTYEKAFAKKVSIKYNVTQQCIYNMLKGRTWANV